MFTLLKLIKHLALPPPLIVIGLAASLYCLLNDKHRLGKALLAAFLLILYLLSIEPVSFFLARSLVSRIGTAGNTAGAEGAEAIVILAGGSRKKVGYRPADELSGTSWRRLWHAVELYRAFDGRIPILYSGGSGDPFDPVSVEAELAKQYALSMGIARDKFWTERTSRNTFENAMETRKILDRRSPDQGRHRVILVTSALHMPRAMLVAEKVGLDAIPAPTDFPIGSLRLDPLSFVPSAEDFGISVASIHEWLGIAGYRLLGRA